MKKENGAIALITLITVLFMIAFLVSTFTIIANRRQAQAELKREMQEIYEKDLDNIDDIYTDMLARAIAGLEENDEPAEPGGPTENTLPSAYQEVEYIASTGTQYIDTGYSNENAFSFEIRAKAPQLNPNQLSFLIGGDTSSALGSQNIYISNLSPYKLSIRYGGSEHSSSSGGTEGYYNYSEYPLANIKSSFKTYKVKYKQFTIDGAYVDNWTNNYLAPNTICNVALFSRNGSSYIGATNTGWQINYAKIYDQNENLVRNFIPCYRKSDGVIGLYDLCGSICSLTGTPFYTNSGSGTFTIPLPEEVPTY